MSLILPSTTFTGMATTSTALCWSRSVWRFLHFCYTTSISSAAYQKCTLAAYIPLQYYSTFSRELRLFPLMLTKTISLSGLNEDCRAFQIMVPHSLSRLSLCDIDERQANCIHEIKVLKSLQQNAQQLAFLLMIYRVYSVASVWFMA